MPPAAERDHALPLAGELPLEVRLAGDEVARDVVEEGLRATAREVVARRADRRGNRSVVDPEGQLDVIHRLALEHDAEGLVGIERHRDVRGRRVVHPVVDEERSGGRRSEGVQVVELSDLRREAALEHRLAIPQLRELRDARGDRDVVDALVVADELGAGQLPLLELPEREDLRAFKTHELSEVERQLQVEEVRVLRARADAAGEVRDDVEDHRRLEVDAGVPELRAEAPPVAAQRLVLPRPHALGRRLGVAQRQIVMLGVLVGRLLGVRLVHLDRPGMLRTVDVMRRHVRLLRPGIDAARWRRRLGRRRRGRRRRILRFGLPAEEQHAERRRDRRDRFAATSTRPSRPEEVAGSLHSLRLPSLPRGGASPPSATAIEVALWSIMPM